MSNLHQFLIVSAIAVAFDNSLQQLRGGYTICTSGRQEATLIFDEAVDVALTWSGTLVWGLVVCYIVNSMMIEELLINDPRSIFDNLSKREHFQ